MSRGDLVAEVLRLRGRTADLEAHIDELETEVDGWKTEAVAWHNLGAET